MCWVHCRIPASLIRTLRLPKPRSALASFARSGLLVHAARRDLLSVAASCCPPPPLSPPQHTIPCMCSMHCSAYLQSHDEGEAQLCTCSRTPVLALCCMQGDCRTSLLQLHALCPHTLLLVIMCILVRADAHRLPVHLTGRCRLAGAASDRPRACLGPIALPWWSCLIPFGPT